MHRRRAAASIPILPLSSDKGGEYPKHLVGEQVVLASRRFILVSVPMMNYLRQNGTKNMALKLEESRVSGSDAENVCYLRNIKDADKLVRIMKSCPDGNAVVIGGGYIGMECAAALVANNIKVTMVFPEKYCMSRLFTPKLAEFYENYYMSKGVTFIKGTVVSSLEVSFGKVTTAVLQNGTRLPANLVVVGIGARANTELFEGQLAMERGGIKVNGQMQTSDASVYAVGDVAAFPVKLFGDVRRLEHVDCARRTARHAVTAALSPAAAAGNIDYLPFFYSRVFALSWRFYGDNAGEAVHFGDFVPSSSAPPKLGAFWVSGGRITGAFLEGGSPEEYDAIADAVRRGAAVPDVAELARQGIAFVVREASRNGGSRGGGATASYAWRRRGRFHRRDRVLVQPQGGGGTSK
ncbi:hypothetical protein PR202_gb09513 [Eleusine coracana subsp. coracana]|uniref:monodehydroascorbate reductase (NADH) n=1 Tax=Eleusine coracana subsp. coracana TaxID=191504 RepID=A0AAV5EF52_ELECO|nr:hypothetical protein PR202_gb09513 [Eleusine coracana subsp. coracana]